MLTRRELLTRATTVLVLVPILGCSSSDDDGGGGGGGGGGCAGVSSTSTVDTAHSHTLCVLTTDLTSPPSAGVSYTTAVESSHTHKVTLSQTELAAINTGQTVMATTSSDVDPINGESHFHRFSIKKA